MKTSVKYYVLIFSSCVFWSTFTEAIQTVLQNEIDANIGQADVAGANLIQHEQALLSLVAKYQSPADKGKIFAAIAQLYSRAEGDQTSQAIKYCEEALRHPLDATDTCNTYILLGNALDRQPRSCGRPMNANERKKIAGPYIRAWDILLQNINVNTRVAPPSGGFKYDVPENDPGYSEVKKKHDAVMAKSKESAQQNKLLDIKRLLTAKTLQLYGKANSSDLRNDAFDILGDREKAQKLIKALANSP